MEGSYILVMCKHKNADEFGMDMGFSVDKLGLVQAIKKAQAHMEEQQAFWKDQVEYRLEGKEF